MSKREVSPTLIGRGRELQLLQEAVTDAPAIVLVEGEAGIGKSRLVREALDDPALAHCRVLVGRCQRLREPFLLAPIVEALRGLQEQVPGLSLGPVGGALRSLIPELAPMLPQDHAPVGYSTAKHHRLFRALRELLSALGPTVCVLDDLQWSDDATLEFLESLLPDFPEKLVIVASYRGDELPLASPLMRMASGLDREAPLTTIEVRSLAEDEVRVLVREILGSHQVSEEFARYLWARTAGVPFVVEEVIRLLDDRDRFALAAGARAIGELEQAGVPPAVRQPILEGLTALSDDARLVTRAAGVLGEPAGEELVAAVAGLAPARAARALTRALQSGPLEEKDHNLYGFRHPLAAEAARGDAPGPQRRRMHLRAAQAFEGRPQGAEPGRLAHHFKEAGRWREWVRHAEVAAVASRAAGDDRSAAHLLEQALCAPEIAPAARIRMAVELGHAAVSSTAPETAIALLQRVLDEEPIPFGTRGELRFCLARLRRYAGQTGSWRAEMLRAVDELCGCPELAACAMSHLARPTLSGSLEKDLSWLRRGVDEAARTSDPVTRVEVRTRQATVLLAMGDPEGRRAVEEIPCEAAVPEEQVKRIRGSRSVAVAAMELGHHALAESLLAAAARVADEFHALPWDPWRASAELSLDWRTGRWEGLETRARDLVRATDGSSLSPGNETVFGSLLATRGQVEEAEQVIAAAVHAGGESRSYVSAVATLARLRLDQGDASGAHELVAPPLGAIERKGIWVWAAELAPIAVRALVSCEELTEARRLAAAFGAGLRGWDAPAARAAEKLCRGAVAEAQAHYDVATRLFHGAERVLVQLPAPYDAACAAEARARCLLARDDERGAQVLFQALEAFETLDASTEASRVRVQLKDQGIALERQRRGGRRAYGNQFSPREAQVARLAGAGRRNREIAETLYISTRTVEAHVASALRKLGVDSRHALAGPEAALALRNADTPEG